MNFFKKKPGKDENQTKQEDIKGFTPAGNINKKPPLGTNTVQALLKCIQHLSDYGLETGLYRVSGHQGFIEKISLKIKEGSIDSNELYNEEMTPHNIASSVKKVLQLHEPLLTYSLRNQIESEIIKADGLSFAELCGQLPILNRTLILALLAHLHVVASSDVAKMPKENLGKTIGLWFLGKDGSQEEIDKSQKIFIALFDAYPEPLTSCLNKVQNEVEEMKGAAVLASEKGDGTGHKMSPTEAEGEATPEERTLLVKWKGLSQPSDNQIKSELENFGQISRVGMTKKKAMVLFASREGVDRTLAGYTGQWQLEPVVASPTPKASIPPQVESPPLRAPSTPLAKLATDSSIPEQVACAVSPDQTPVAANPQERTVIVQWKGVPTPGEEEVREEMEKFGEVSNFAMKKKKALCMFQSIDSAQKAVRQYCGNWQLELALGGSASDSVPKDVSLPMQKNESPLQTSKQAVSNEKPQESAEANIPVQEKPAKKSFFGMASKLISKATRKNSISRKMSEDVVEAQDKPPDVPEKLDNTAEISNEKPVPKQDRNAYNEVDTKHEKESNETVLSTKSSLPKVSPLTHDSNTFPDAEVDDLYVSQGENSDEDNYDNSPKLQSRSRLSTGPNTFKKSAERSRSILDSHGSVEDDWPVSVGNAERQCQGLDFDDQDMVLLGTKGVFKFEGPTTFDQVDTAFSPSPIAKEPKLHDSRMIDEPNRVQNTVMQRPELLSNQFLSTQNSQYAAESIFEHPRQDVHKGFEEKFTRQSSDLSPSSIKQPIRSTVTKVMGPASPQAQQKSAPMYQLPVQEKYHAPPTSEFYDHTFDILKARIDELENLLLVERQHSNSLQRQHDEAHRSWIEEVTKVRVGKLEAEEDAKTLRMKVTTLESRLACYEAELSSLSRMVENIELVKESSRQKMKQEVASTSILQEKIIAALQNEVDTTNGLRRVLQEEVADLQEKFNETIKDLIQWRNRCYKLESVLLKHGLDSETNDVEFMHQIGRMMLETRVVKVIDQKKSCQPPDSSPETRKENGNEFSSQPDNTPKSEAHDDTDNAQNLSFGVTEETLHHQAVQIQELTQNQRPLLSEIPSLSHEEHSSATPNAQQQPTSTELLARALKEFTQTQRPSEVASMAHVVHSTAPIKEQQQPTSKEFFAQALKAQEELSARLGKQLERTRNELESLRLGSFANDIPGDKGNYSIPPKVFSKPNVGPPGLQNTGYSGFNIPASSVARMVQQAQFPAYNFQHQKYSQPNGYTGTLNQTPRIYTPVSKGLQDWMHDRQKQMHVFQR